MPIRAGRRLTEGGRHSRAGAILLNPAPADLAEAPVMPKRLAAFPVRPVRSSIVWGVMAWILIVLSGLLFLLTLGFAFTIYAYIAASLAVVSLGAGSWLLARRTEDGASTM